MTYETIRWDLDGGILTLTLDRPDRLNAFTPRMMHELLDAFVRSVHSADDLLPAAYALAREMAGGTAPVSVALTRQMLWRGMTWLNPWRPIALRVAESMSEAARPTAAKA